MHSWAAYVIKWYLGDSLPNTSPTFFCLNYNFLTNSKTLSSVLHHVIVFITFGPGTHSWFQPIVFTILLSEMFWSFICQPSSIETGITYIEYLFYVNFILASTNRKFVRISVLNVKWIFLKTVFHLLFFSVLVNTTSKLSLHNITREFHEISWTKCLFIFSLQIKLQLVTVSTYKLIDLSSYVLLDNITKFILLLYTWFVLSICLNKYAFPVVWCCVGTNSMSLTKWIWMCFIECYLLKWRFWFFKDFFLKILFFFFCGFQYKFPCFFQPGLQFIILA